MENEQKMPTGMRVVLGIFYLILLSSLAAFLMYDDSSPLLGNLFLASAVFGLATTLFLITSVHARKWWKINIALMGLQLFESATLSLYNLSALPSVTVEQVGVITKNSLAVSALITVAVQLIILIYVYKHRSYFYKDLLIINN